MSLKLKALSYTIGILVGISAAVGISIFLVFAFITPFILSLVLLISSLIMSGALIYPAVIDSLNNTLRRKNKGVQ